MMKSYEDLEKSQSGALNELQHNLSLYANSQSKKSLFDQQESKFSIFKSQNCQEGHDKSRFGTKDSSPDSKARQYMKRVPEICKLDSPGYSSSLFFHIFIDFDIYLDDPEKNI